MRDLITVTDLELRTPALEVDHWQRPSKDQPLVCTLVIRTDVDSEAQHDNLLTGSLNYGTVTKAIETFVAQLSSPTQSSPDGIALEVVAEDIAKVILFQANAPNVRLELRRPRALLTADSIGVSISRARSDYIRIVPTPLSSPDVPDAPDSFALSPTSSAQDQDTFFVRSLRRYIVIGLNPCERLDEQEVIVDLDFHAATDNMRLPTGARAGWRGWREAVKRVESHLSTSAPLTIELITTDVARIITAPPPPSLEPATWDVPQATVRIAKPVALMFAKHPSVQVTRSRTDFLQRSIPSRRFSTSSRAVNVTPHTAFLGLGTNLGDRVENLANALTKLREFGKEQIQVVDTSFLYESEAMYHEEQNQFLNAAVKVETALTPPALLEVLKQVEACLGRDFSTFRNGPRVIDLDLLLYDDHTFERSRETDEDDRWLKVPHESMQEREFVLRPLVDIAPLIRHPGSDLTLTEHLTALLAHTRSTVHRVFPLSKRSIFPYTRPSTLPCAAAPHRTLLMSILNTTPDSFSDGGVNESLDSAISSSRLHLSLGADVLDIGGMSTRPGAADVTEEEEASRVIPLIDALRTKDRCEVPISIDTFRARVATAAVRAGATMINDVHGGREPGMLCAMREAGVPVVLMHSRGDSKTMTTLTDYGTEGVVEGVRREMEGMVTKALDAGLARWNIILDPGIGFAKTQAQNYTLLRHLDSLFADSPLLREFPVLVGLSRKKFLAPEKDAHARVFETTVGVTATIASGRCEIARVHDTQEVKAAVKVADAIYRGSSQE